MSASLSIFKQTNRYSEADRPELGEQCFFSHAHRLLHTEFVPFARTFDRPELHQNAIVTVKRNRPHVIEVLFDGAAETDLVSPEFLIPITLTSFGQELVSSVGMSAAMKIGASI